MCKHVKQFCSSCWFLRLPEVSALASKRSREHYRSTWHTSRRQLGHHGSVDPEHTAECCGSAAAMAPKGRDTRIWLKSMIRDPQKTEGHPGRLPWLERHPALRSQSSDAALGRARAPSPGSASRSHHAPLRTLLPHWIHLRQCMQHPSVTLKVGEECVQRYLDSGISLSHYGMYVQSQERRL